MELARSAKEDMHPRLKGMVYTPPTPRLELEQHSELGIVLQGPQGFDAQAL
jgi:hypothetical protein